MPGDWERFATQLTDAAKEIPRGGGEDHPRKYPLARSDYYGSSLNFAVQLRIEEPHLRVPEHEIALVEGRQVGWSPEDERPSEGGECPKCRDGIDTNGGSLRYCPKCNVSGFEHKLAMQLKMAGIPPKQIS